MVDGKQLRVGNVVYKRDEIVTLDISEYIKLWRMPLKYCPVPLTEEILLKCGFKKTKGSVMFPRIYVFKGVRIVISNSNNFYYRYSLDTIIDDLHSLQNLFFSLKGYELDPKM